MKLDDTVKQMLADPQQRAAAEAKAFNLTYMHQVLPNSVYLCFEPRAVRVFMLRHRADRLLGESEDSFTLHSWPSGEWLGWGDTKADAESDAAYRLMAASRDEYEAAHRTAAKANESTPNPRMRRNF